MISIGADIGGPEQEGSEVRLTIRAALRAIESFREANGADVEPVVNVVSHVPGSIMAPAWVDGLYQAG